MAKDDVGVFQLANGNWAYRIAVVVDGKYVTERKVKDQSGIVLTTKRAAIKARKMALAKIYEPKPTTPVIKKTFKDVFLEYCEKGRSGKAYGTKCKQDSLWKNHLCQQFGNRYVDEISVAEVTDYLSDLYYQKGYSYAYVEGFLKMFYLIFGQAYARNYLDIDTYHKLCVSKGIRIQMPKRKNDEDTDIVAFSKEEIRILDQYFKNTNAETAYMLGRYCGLRINECYGLKWSNIDLEAGTIRIDRQMQYQEGLIMLVPVKTRNAKRTIYMSPKLQEYFTSLFAQREKDILEKAEVREQKQMFLKDLDGKMISSLELVNSLPDGKMQTVNSMKYHSRMLKEQFHIEFKYHYLRHTYGTFMADMNTPTHLLCNQMGHGNIHVTQRYYISFSKTGTEILCHNLKML